jgi:hypothetical protein
VAGKGRPKIREVSDKKLDFSRAFILKSMDFRHVSFELQRVKKLRGKACGKEHTIVQK